MEDGELYRQKAAEMYAQAERAEIPYLKAFYQDIAEHWAHLADQLGEGVVPPPKPELRPLAKL